MEMQRTLLLIALVVVSLLLWNAWQKDHVQRDHAQKAQTIEQQAIKTSGQQTITGSAGEAMPSTSTTTAGITRTAAPAASLGLASANVPADRVITVKTDVLTVKIDANGGNIISAALPKYPESMETPNIPVELLSNNPDNYYVAESALISQKGPGSTTQRARYTSSQRQYQLADGKDVLKVTLKWRSADGVSVDKVYTFRRGDYLIDLNYDIGNGSTRPWEGKLYTQLTRKDVKEKREGFFQIHPYKGGAIATPEDHYQKISFKDMNKASLNQEVKGGWVAMVQHYFLGAWIPNQQQTSQFYTQALPNKMYTIGMIGPTLKVPPGEKLTTGAQLYTGPEIASRLEQIAPGLNLTVSYGWLWPISVVIFWVMKHIYDVVGNWGWAIVLVTLLIKLIFYPLASKSYRSMAGMRKLQPKIEAIRESYADDKQKLSQAMMQLYKREKVNPLGGCLPILIQIPVFFALYMVLIESVELRQAPWIFWIRDLSMPDPYFVLPILMGVTMFIQQRLNPPPPDPTQAKIMMLLPVVFTFLFIYFPAGLVLYWVVNNALSISQQWYIMYLFDKQHHAKKT